MKMDCFGRNTKRTFIIPEKKELPGYKLMKNRVTLLLIVNSRVILKWGPYWCTIQIPKVSSRNNMIKSTLCVM